MTAPLQVDITIPDIPADIIVAELKSAGADSAEKVQAVGTSSTEILIVTIIAVQALINVVIRLLQLVKCGVIIDARGARPHVRRERTLPNGTVVILSAKGEKVEVRNPTASDLGALFKLLSPKSAE